LIIRNPLGKIFLTISGGFESLTNIDSDTSILNTRCYSALASPDFFTMASGEKADQETSN
jgi:hypothetical protein